MIRIEVPIDEKDAKRREIKDDLSRILISEPFGLKNIKFIRNLAKIDGLFHVYLVNTFEKISESSGLYSISMTGNKNDVCLSAASLDEALSLLQRLDSEMTFLFSCSSNTLKEVLLALDSSSLFKFTELQIDGRLFNQVDTLGIVFSYSRNSDIMEIVTIESDISQLAAAFCSE